MAVFQIENTDNPQTYKGIDLTLNFNLDGEFVPSLLRVDNAKKSSIALFVQNGTVDNLISGNGGKDRGNTLDIRQTQDCITNHALNSVRGALVKGTLNAEKLDIKNGFDIVFQGIIGKEAVIDSANIMVDPLGIDYGAIGLNFYIEGTFFPIGYGRIGSSLGLH